MTIIHRQQGGKSRYWDRLEIRIQSSAASKMARRIKVLALRAEGLSLVLRTPRVEQEGGVSWEW